MTSTTWSWWGPGLRSVHGPPGPGGARPRRHRHRSGGRPGRHVVLEPLSRSPVRLGELLLLLHVLPDPARRVGLVVALPRAARDPALPRVRRRPPRPAPQLRLQIGRAHV